jgi:hypothetical protein
VPKVLDYTSKMGNKYVIERSFPEITQKMIDFSADGSEMKSKLEEPIIKKTASMESLPPQPVIEEKKPSIAKGAPAKGAPAQKEIP